jgi:hypothetical protein
MKIYIAGPMRGIKFYNFPAFDEAEIALLRLGSIPVSPANLDRDAGFNPFSLPDDTDWSKTPEDFSFEACMKRDIDALMQCDGIYMLKGWEQSKGATAEHSIAVWAQKKIYYEKPPLGNRGSTLPVEASARKQIPIYSGVVRYFPDALVAVAKVSYIGNQQHHPDQPLHWDKSKSADEEDAMMRHIVEQEWDKVAWRALANLQRKIEGGWRSS